jgi:ABC-2 type transport system permease protein
MQKIGKWMPSYSFGNGAWGIVHGEAFAWKNAFILLGYFIIFMILSMYVRKKQRVV